MITDILICLLAAILGGFFMRLRGMDLGISTTFNRVMIAVVFGLTGLACGLPWPYAVAVILTSFAAAILGWGAHQRMHRDVYHQPMDHIELVTRWMPKVFGVWRDDWSVARKTLYQITGMSTVGLAKQSLVSLPILFWSPWAGVIIALSGLAWGPVYWLGWQTNRLWGMDWHETWAAWDGRPILGHLRSGGEWGEVFIGVWWFGVAAAALSFWGV